ncbi:MAG TPA: hypothetical protein ENN06_11830 [Desulfobacteraceae bacterium]|nr:hypothetical protein [Desulfobacteraceae bacterium]
MKISGIVFLAAALGLSATAALAAEIIDCKVVSARKDTLILDCGRKAVNLKPGETVKIRSISKKRAPLMGC